MNKEQIAKECSNKIDLLVAEYCGIGFSKDEYDKEDVEKIILSALTRLEEAINKVWADQYNSLHDTSLRIESDNVRLRQRT